MRTIKCNQTVCFGSFGNDLLVMMFTCEIIMLSGFCQEAVELERGCRQIKIDWNSLSLLCFVIQILVKPVRSV